MNIEKTLEEVARSYPQPGMVKHQLGDVQRMAFSIRLAIGERDPKTLSVCDLGGGLSMFTPGCAALGMRAVVVDDFQDYGTKRDGDDGFVPHRKYGVEIISRDLIKEGLTGLGPFDAVTSFDSMEHWHDSPKALFAQVREKLSQGGMFVLGVPNCVNLRKRITVPLGYGKWSQMADWYEAEKFRGHVREPDVSDLRYIARDMKLRDVKVVGRNWQGYRSHRPAMRTLTRLVDAPLRMFPSLCADLYLTGRA